METVPPRLVAPPRELSFQTVKELNKHCLISASNMRNYELSLDFDSMPSRSAFQKFDSSGRSILSVTSPPFNGSGTAQPDA